MGSFQHQPRHLMQLAAQISWHVPCASQVQQPWSPAGIRPVTRSASRRFGKYRNSPLPWDKCKVLSRDTSIPKLCSSWSFCRAQLPQDGSPRQWGWQWSKLQICSAGQAWLGWKSQECQMQFLWGGEDFQTWHSQSCIQQDSRLSEEQYVLLPSHATLCTT